MEPTADQAFQDLTVDEQQAVSQVRQQIQLTSYDQLEVEQASEVRTKYEASIADDEWDSIETRPVDRQVSLELIERGVPLDRWTEIAQKVAAKNPVIETKYIEERVNKMENTQTERAVPIAPPGTPIHELTPDQVAEVGRREVQRLIRAGVIEPAPQSAEAGR